MRNNNVSRLAIQAGLFILAAQSAQSAHSLRRPPAINQDVRVARVFRAQELCQLANVLRITAVSKPDLCEYLRIERGIAHCIHLPPHVQAE